MTGFSQIKFEYVADFTMSDKHITYISIYYILYVCIFSMGRNQFNLIIAFYGVFSWSASLVVPVVVVVVALLVLLLGL